MKKKTTLKTLIILLFFSLLFCFEFSECQAKRSTNIQVQFDAFIKNFHKPYINGTPEYWKRLHVFEQNVRRHAKLNSLRIHNDSAVYGVNKFSDLTPEEFREKYLNYKPMNIAPPFSKNSTKLQFLSAKDGALPRNEIPKGVDWRDHNHKNVVTPVKNQKSCGGCWAFSSVETIESMHAIKSGTLTKLSVQEMIDCAGDGNYGCRGGDTCSALLWMKTTKTGLVTDAQYPLTDESNYCKIFPIGTKGVEIKDYTCQSYINQENEMLYQLATHGPILVTVDATTWHDYQKGIIMYHCPDHNNHAVQIVGYDLTGDVPYYIVRNSWGDDFGLGGYLKIRYAGNLCGIAERVSTVIL